MIIDSNIPPMPAKLPEFFVTKEELENGLFNMQQLSALKISCQRCDGADREYINRLKDTCRKLINPRALRQLVDFNIRYVSQFAKEELERRRTNGAT